LHNIAQLHRTTKTVEKLYACTVKFDMMRVRKNGVVVPRHNCGMMRVVRGTFDVREVRHADLQRHVRTAVFRTESGEHLELLDATMMHASADTWVLSGFERDDSRVIPVDYAQTWILTEPVGDVPEPTMGPKFLR